MNIKAFLVSSNLSYYFASASNRRRSSTSGSNFLSPEFVRPSSYCSRSQNYKTSNKLKFILRRIDEQQLIIIGFIGSYWIFNDERIG